MTGVDVDTAGWPTNLIAPRTRRNNNPKIAGAATRCVPDRDQPDQRAESAWLWSAAIMSNEVVKAKADSPARGQPYMVAGKSRCAEISGYVRAANAVGRDLVRPVFVVEDVRHPVGQDRQDDLQTTVASNTMAKPPSRARNRSADPDRTSEVRLLAQPSVCRSAASRRRAVERPEGRGQRSTRLRSMPSRHDSRPG